MIAQDFAYLAAGSLEEAVAALGADPGTSRAVGGGTWVIPECNRGECSPRLLVDLRTAGLDGIRPGDGSIAVGATCTYADLIDSALVARQLPLLHRMATGITGGRQIQNQGTVGGSAVAARPQSDVPAVITAMRATAVVRGLAGERRIPADELFTGAMQSALRPGEVLAALEFPVATERTTVGYHKLKRSAGSWPIATAAAQLTWDEGGRVSAATLVLGGVAETPVPVDVDDLLVGQSTLGEAMAEVASRASAAVTRPWTDELAPGSYRAAVAGPVAQRALAGAARRDNREGGNDGAGL
ncbi:MAG: hypothetical protein JWQ93_3040 [Marmoricola sp.]|nr:hypothetical protein [Marmoricola sp.]